MLTVTSATQQPDYIALAMVLVLALVVTIMALRKRFGTKKVAQSEVVSATPSVQPSSLTAPGSAGQLKLHDVAPKTAAMLMAIVADKMGMPLNELRFLSIKEVK